MQEYGRCLINLCKSSGYNIMNGRLRNINNTGDFTCYKENGDSVVDYLICQPSCMHLITDFSNLSKRAVSEIHHRLVQEYNITKPKCKWQYNDLVRLKAE